MKPSSTPVTLKEIREIKRKMEQVSSQNNVCTPEAHYFGTVPEGVTITPEYLNGTMPSRCQCGLIERNGSPDDFKTSEMRL